MTYPEILLKKMLGEYKIQNDILSDFRSLHPNDWYRLRTFVRLGFISDYILHTSYEQLIEDYKKMYNVEVDKEL